MWILVGGVFLNTLFKVVVILMLVVLIVGPLLQIYDCFNDAPNLDHDALLHTIDALLCLVFALLFSCLLIVALAIIQYLGSLLESCQCCSSRPTCDRRAPIPSPQALPLRI